MASKVEITQQTADKKKRFAEQVQAISDHIVMLTQTVNNIKNLILSGASGISRIKNDINAARDNVKRAASNIKNLPDRMLKQVKNSTKSIASNAMSYKTSISNSIENPLAVGKIPLITGSNLTDAPKQIIDSAGNVGASNIRLLSNIPHNMTESVSNLTDDAFNLTDNALGFIDREALIYEDAIPSRISEKISTKELERKLRMYQEQLDNYKKTAQDWIKEHTAEITAWITNAQNTAKEQIDRQIQRKLNSIAVFTGMDPVLLNNLLEQGVDVAKAYATNDPNAKDRLKVAAGTAIKTAASVNESTKALADAAGNAAQLYIEGKEAVETIQKIRI